MFLIVFAAKQINDKKHFLFQEMLFYFYLFFQSEPFTLSLSETFGSSGVV